MDDDLQIVRRVQAGDSGAFALLVERYHRPLLAFVHRLLRDESVVEDIGQEVFLSVYRSLRSFDEERAVPFAAWLFIVARNRCISELRRRRGKVFLPAEALAALAGPAGPTPEARALDAEELRKVETALELLPAPYRVAIIGSLRGDSLDEQALAEGIAPGTAKSRLWRARERLRRLLPERRGGVDHEGV